jgi:hypothetical protein
VKVKSNEYVITWVYGETQITERREFETDMRMLAWITSSVRAGGEGPTALIVSEKLKDGLRDVMHLIF